MAVETGQPDARGTGDEQGASPEGPEGGPAGPEGSPDGQGAWPSERGAGDGEHHASAGGQDASAGGQDASAGGQQPSRRIQLIEAAQARWISTLTDLGGRNTLLYYKDRRAGTLDLAGADPDALERFCRSGSIRLTRLFSDADLRADAIRRVQAIYRKARELLEERGIRAAYLATGLDPVRDPVGAAGHPGAGTHPGAPGRAGADHPRPRRPGARRAV
jgi:hypothetical protein